MEIKVQEEGNVTTLSVIDDDGNSFFVNASFLEDDLEDVLLGEEVYVDVEGPIKVGGEYHSRLTVQVPRSLGAAIEVAPSDRAKFLRLRTGDFICRQSLFLVVHGERREITVDQLPINVSTP